MAVNKKSKKEESPEVIQNRGTGFVSLGRISLLVTPEKLRPYLSKIFDLVDAEIAKKPTNISKEIYVKPLQNTDVLYCIRDLAEKYGDEFERRYSGPMDMSLNNSEVS